MRYTTEVNRLIERSYRADKKTAITDKFFKSDKRSDKNIEFVRNDYINKVNKASYDILNALSKSYAQLKSTYEILKRLNKQSKLTRKQQQMLNSIERSLHKFKYDVDYLNKLLNARGYNSTKEFFYDMSKSNLLTINNKTDNTNFIDKLHLLTIDDIIALSRYDIDNRLNNVLDLVSDDMLNKKLKTSEVQRLSASIANLLAIDKVLHPALFKNDDYKSMLQKYAELELRFVNLVERVYSKPLLWGAGLSLWALKNEYEALNSFLDYSDLYRTLTSKSLSEALLNQDSINKYYSIFEDSGFVGVYKEISHQVFNNLGDITVSVASDITSEIVAEIARRVSVYALFNLANFFKSVSLARVAFFLNQGLLGFLAFDIAIEWSIEFLLQPALYQQEDIKRIIDYLNVYRDDRIKADFEFVIRYLIDANKYKGLYNEFLKAFNNLPVELRKRALDIANRVKERRKSAQSLARQDAIRKELYKAYECFKNYYSKNYLTQTFKALPDLSRDIVSERVKELINKYASISDDNASELLNAYEIVKNTHMIAKTTSGRAPGCTETEAWFGRDKPQFGPPVGALKIGSVSTDVCERYQKMYWSPCSRMRIDLSLMRYTLTTECSRHDKLLYVPPYDMLVKLGYTGEDLSLIQSLRNKTFDYHSRATGSENMFYIDVYLDDCAYGHPKPEDLSMHHRSGTISIAYTKVPAVIDINNFKPYGNYLYFKQPSDNCPPFALPVQKNSIFENVYRIDIRFPWTITITHPGERCVISEESHRSGGGGLTYCEYVKIEMKTKEFDLNKFLPYIKQYRQVRARLSDALGNQLDRLYNNYTKAYNKLNDQINSDKQRLTNEFEHLRDKLDKQEIPVRKLNELNNRLKSKLNASHEAMYYLYYLYYNQEINIDNNYYLSIISSAYSQNKKQIESFNSNYEQDYYGYLNTVSLNALNILNSFNASNRCMPLTFDDAKEEFIDSIEKMNNDILNILTTLNLPDHALFDNVIEKTATNNQTYVDQLKNDFTELSDSLDTPPSGDTYDTPIDSNEILTNLYYHYQNLLTLTSAMYNQLHDSLNRLYFETVKQLNEFYDKLLSLEKDKIANIAKTLAHEEIIIEMIRYTALTDDKHANDKIAIDKQTVTLTTQEINNDALQTMLNMIS